MLRCTAMRRLLGTGVAVLIAHGDVRADPSAPQVTPLPARREDAQRLREQLRGLEGVRVPAAVTLPSAGAAATMAPGAASTEPTPTNKVAVALLTIAGVAGISTLGLVIAASPGSNGSDYDTVEAALGVTAAVTGALGLFTLIKSQGQSVQVAPTVTPKAVGLAISG